MTLVPLWRSHAVGPKGMPSENRYRPYLPCDFAALTFHSSAPFELEDGAHWRLRRSGGGDSDCGTEGTEGRKGFASESERRDVAKVFK